MGTLLNEHFFLTTYYFVDTEAYGMKFLVFVLFCILTQIKNIRKQHLHQERKLFLPYLFLSLANQPAEMAKIWSVAYLARSQGGLKYSERYSRGNLFSLK